MMKTIYNFFKLSLFVLLLTAFSCGPDRLPKPPESVESGTTKIPSTKYSKISHVAFYIENSGSMFGYVNGTTEFVNAVNDLAQFPNLVSSNTPFSYYLISGKEGSSNTNQRLQTYSLGNEASVLRNQLTINSFNKPSSGFSDLKNMFEIALGKARNDSISILISDCIYDVGGSSEPLTALDTEGQLTRSKFINRLQNDDIESLVIKLESKFDGLYHPANVNNPQGTSAHIIQKRPYYIWVFGNSELLKKYFLEERLKDLMGYIDFARFRKLSNYEFPFIGIGYNNFGFKLDFKESNTFKLHHNVTESSYFNLAVDFSNLNLSDSYLKTPGNYFCSGKYVVKEINSIGTNPVNELKPYLSILSFKPTHIVTIASTTIQPETGEMTISLNNNLPSWISETNANNDYPFDGNTDKTFGFSTLIKGIKGAYDEVSTTEQIAKFNVTIKN